jgi:gamma-glutamyltranspeptidase
MACGSNRGAGPSLQTFTVKDQVSGQRRTPRAGEIFKNPALGETLSKVANGGCEEFCESGVPIV